LLPEAVAEVVALTKAIKTNNPQVGVVINHAELQVLLMVVTALTTAAMAAAVVAVAVATAVVSVRLKT